MSEEFVAALNIIAIVLACIAIVFAILTVRINRKTRRQIAEWEARNK